MLNNRSLELLFLVLIEILHPLTSISLTFKINFANETIIFYSKLPALGLALRHIGYESTTYKQDQYIIQTPVCVSKAPLPQSSPL